MDKANLQQAASRSENPFSSSCHCSRGSEVSGVRSDGTAAKRLHSIMDRLPEEPWDEPLARHRGLGWRLPVRGGDARRYFRLLPASRIQPGKVEMRQGWPWL